MSEIVKTENSQPEKLTNTVTHSKQVSSRFRAEIQFGPFERQVLFSRIKPENEIRM